MEINHIINQFGGFKKIKLKKKTFFYFFHFFVKIFLFFVFIKRDQNYMGGSVAFKLAVSFILKVTLIIYFSRLLYIYLFFN